MSVPVFGDDGVDDAFERGTGGAHGREIPKYGEQRVVIHGQGAVHGAAVGGPGEAGAPVSPLQALRRVARAEPSGAIKSVKAWFMDSSGSERRKRGGGDRKS